jgi:SPASM domain peptide maturase of grasp-with-spasm system
MSNKIYSLFANCVLVKGVSRSIIMDLQRSDYHIVPNSFTDLITDNRVIHTSSFAELKIMNKELVHSYLEYLISKDLIFEIENLNELDAYPQLDTQFYYPAKISNILIDSNKHSKHDFDFLINELSFVAGCRHVQFRFFDSTDDSFFSELVGHVENSNLVSVEFILPYSSIETSRLIQLFESTLKIKTIVLSSAPENKLVYERRQITSKILSVTEIIDSSNCCGHIHPTYFTCNYQTYFESLNSNSCLNGKLSIDVHGEVANCPLMNDRFGHFKSLDINNLVAGNKFKSVWAIKKDDIKICQDCEFRHICTDCRAHIDDPSDIYSHPSKCSYNPYQAKWEDEEGYIPVTELTDEQISKLKSAAD